MIKIYIEIDMKKIVALSTLSQLGVIICALGRGFAILAFFHLVAHAFFKALLFIRAGRLIHASESYQDLRVIGGTSEIIPYRIGVVIGCSGRLRGLPFISAFYSKEIKETLGRTKHSQEITRRYFWNADDFMHGDDRS